MIVIGLVSSPVIVTKGPLMLIFHEIACVPQENTKTRLIFHVKHCISLSQGISLSQDVSLSLAMWLLAGFGPWGAIAEGRRRKREGSGYLCPWLIHYRATSSWLHALPEDHSSSYESSPYMTLPL